MLFPDRIFLINNKTPEHVALDCIHIFPYCQYPNYDAIHSPPIEAGHFLLILVKLISITATGFVPAAVIFIILQEEYQILRL